MLERGLGYKSFHTAWKTIRGIEIMRMIYKGQVEGEAQKGCFSRKEICRVSVWNCSSLKLDNHRVIMSFSTFCDRTRNRVAPHSVSTFDLVWVDNRSSYWGFPRSKLFNSDNSVTR